MEIKDDLYYDDLKYYIKKIATLPYLDDKNKDIMIEQRMQMQEHFKIDETTKRQIPYYTISSFQSDFFKFINLINELTGECLESPYELFKHKKLVEEKLDEYIDSLKNSGITFEDDSKKIGYNITKNKK